MSKIRLLCRIDDIGAAANVGGPVQTTWRTIDIDVPGEVHQWLTEEQKWVHRTVAGIEALAELEKSNG